MGMFDEILWKGRRFQTKDLKCELDVFCIDTGRLVLTGTTTADYEPEYLLFDLDFHGDLVFYEYLDAESRMDYFKARFNNGCLKWIKKLDCA